MPLSIQGVATTLQLDVLRLLFTIIGLYGIFAKMGQKSRLAFVPFVNYAKLGDLIDMPKIGAFTALFGILNFGRQCITLYVPDLYAYYFVIFSIELAIQILYAIFRTILLNGLRRILGLKWPWIILFIFLPGVTLACWGFSKKIQV